MRATLALNGLVIMNVQHDNELHEIQYAEAVVRRCSVKKGVLRDFAKSTGKHLCQSLFFDKVAGRLRLRTLSKNTFYNRRPLVAASEYDAEIIHVGINDILRSKTESDLNKLPNNIIDIARTCRSYSIRKIFLSSVSPSFRTFINAKKTKNNKLKQTCQENNFFYR